MIPIKNSKEIEKMRHAGRISSLVLKEVCLQVREGVTTEELNEITKQVMSRHGAVSTSFGFRSGKNVFYGYGCFSVNDEIVHGLPSSEKILKNGDIISVDLAMSVDGFVGDNTRTIVVGEVSKEAQKLIHGTEEALQSGIDAALPGNTVGDISAAIQECAKRYGLGIVRELVGHGIGRSMHEEPEVPNYGQKGKGPVLRPGMTLAIEPMFTLGSPRISVDSDGWTIRTMDKSLAAHSEHTILITDNLPEVLTLLKK